MLAKLGTGMATCLYVCESHCYISHLHLAVHNSEPCHALRTLSSLGLELSWQ